MLSPQLQLNKQIREAIERKDVDSVQKLIGSSKEVLTQMTPFGTWLHVAASAGNIEIIRLLLKLGIEVNRRGGPFGGVAINEAACAGKLEMVQELVSAGSELDVSEPERNPLFSAIYHGHLHIVEYLIANGLDHTVRYTGEYMKKMDAVAFAKERGQLTIAAYLSEKQRGGTSHNSM